MIMYLASNIDWLWIISGKKQSEFSKQVGINEDKLYTYKTGKAVPDRSIQEKFAAIAGVTVEQLHNVDLRTQTLHVINPDTKKVEVKIALNGANQHEKNEDHLRQLLKQKDAIILEKDERLKEKDERIKLLTQLLEKSSKKS